MLFDCRRTPLTRTSCASVPSVQLDMGNIFKHYNVLEAEKYSLTLMHKAPDAPLGPHGKVRRRGAAVGVVSRPAAGAASAVVRWFFFLLRRFGFESELMDFFSRRLGTVANGAHGDLHRQAEAVLAGIAAGIAAAVARGAMQRIER